MQVDILWDNWMQMTVTSGGYMPTAPQGAKVLQVRVRHDDGTYQYFSPVVQEVIVKRLIQTVDVEKKQ